MTDSAPLVEDARARIDAAPSVRYCYQEYRGDTGADAYSVHCHTTANRCEIARGPNPRLKQTPCIAVDLSRAAWSPAKGGFMGSWYQYSAKPFAAPFPQFGDG